MYSHNEYVNKVENANGLGKEKDPVSFSQLRPFDFENTTQQIKM